MQARKCSIEDLESALVEVNKRYRGNVEFRNIEQRKSYIIFTLRVRDSHKPGHRRGMSWDGKPGKRMAFACWHVHGYFFEALFRVNPECYVVGGMSSLANPGAKLRIDRHGGNWEDRNIGSDYYPLMFSDACDCAEDGSLDWEE